MSKENEFAQNYHFKGGWCIINSFIPYYVSVLNSEFFFIFCLLPTDQGIVYERNAANCLSTFLELLFSSRHLMEI